MTDTRFNSLKLLFIVVPSMLISCCAPTEKSSSQSNTRIQLIRSGEYLVHQKQPDTAIELLTPYLDSNEDSEFQSKIRLVIASAHVQKSGIEIYDFIQFLKKIQNLLGTSSSELNRLEQRLELILKSRHNENRIEVAKHGLLQIYTALFRILDILEAMQALPQPSEQNLNELEIAIETLATASPHMSRGGFLYRGSLKLIRLNYNLQQKSYFKNIKSCPLSLLELEVNINRVLFDFTSILQDVALSYPDQKQSIEDSLNSFRPFNAEEHLLEMNTEDLLRLLKLIELVEEDVCDN